LEKEYQEIEKSKVSVTLADGAKEITPNEKEKKELEAALNDSGYLEHAPEAVGYGNSQLQMLAYSLVATHLPPDDSILDFGCGRGDFAKYYETNFKKKPNYIGVDMKQPLIEAGKSVHNNEVNLICSDWFKLDSKLIQDWCINVASNNLRYDADTITDLDYLHSTIESMYHHAKKGVVVLLTSTHSKVQDGLINYNPGDLLNWSQQTFGYSAIDHTVSNDGFILLIYKNLK
jgi:SAM-dependent methyltransferase